MSKRMDSSEDSRVATLRARVSKALNGFTTDFPSDLDPWDMSSRRPEAKQFPVPELVLFMMRNVMQWQWSGLGEKVRWTVYGSVEGEPVAFELQKFGFAILTAEGGKVPFARIEGQLQSALKHVEAFLEPIASAQVAAGEAIIANRFDEFDTRYRFFRGLAEKAYATANRPPRKRKKDTGVTGEVFQLTDALNHRLRANRQGFFHSTAMVDSYFSALEHRLVLLRAFSGKPMAKGDLLALLGADWDDKLKSILPTGEKGVADLLGKLRRIKERIRNPFAHGGVENDKGSLFFHLPTVGAIPANFCRFGDSVRFSFIPIEADDHAEACKIFDTLDALLSQGELAGPHRLMVDGVDPSFDRESLARYAAAVAGGPQAVEALSHEWGDAWTRHANMER